MKVAYVTSKYPAVSHTFVMREVSALRARGLEVGTFSIRKATAADVQGSESEAEAARTRWLVPVPCGQWLAAFAWAAMRCPGRLLHALWHAVRQPIGPQQRLLGLCYFLEAVLLARWLVRGGYQHLHCHFGNSGASTAMLAAELAGLPFSLTVHGSELRDPARHRLAEKVARAAFVVCVSWYGRAQLMLLCPPEHWSKLHVIRCGVPAVEPAARPAPPGGCPEILCVARLSAEKGHRVLLDALAELRTRGVRTHCTLIGDGPLVEELRKRATELALNGAVTFAGALPVDRVLERYPSADVVVLASFSEGVPVVLMEAMTRGRPVIATSVGGVPELVRHRETGLLVPPGHATALADALQWVLTHPSEAADLAARGREWVRAEFAPQPATTQLVGLLEESIRCPKPGPTLSQLAPA